MPVVNLPAPQSHHTINQNIISYSQLQSLLTFTAALVGPIAVVTLIASLGKRYKSSLDPSLLELHPAKISRQSQPWLSKQSYKANRGRSMPPSGKSEKVSPVEVDDREDPSDRLSTAHIQDRGLESERKQSTMRKPSASGVIHNQTPSPQLPAVTSPRFSTAAFSFQDRRISMAASVNGDFEASLMDHMSSEPNSRPSTDSTADTTAHSSTQASSPMSLRKSHPRNIERIHTGPSATSDRDDDIPSFSPSSFPSSNPILPLAPHVSFETEEMDDTGEFVVSEDIGVDWQRHTRVYGGGVCLACLATGGNHDEGGFYGDNVPLEERRR
ncbi:hypothetical protein GGR57DRAFT_158268 [Xylariaceae sp. FL1272]|nr:hypothetical protein GGR57DRAFT_158268 [Xylariaceae sp. FL1272]